MDWHGIQPIGVHPGAKARFSAVAAAVRSPSANQRRVLAADGRPLMRSQPGACGLATEQLAGPSLHSEEHLRPHLPRSPCRFG